MKTKGQWKAYVAASIAIVSGLAVFFGVLSETRGNIILATPLGILTALLIKIAYSFIARRRKWSDYTYADFVSDIFSTPLW